MLSPPQLIWRTQPNFLYTLLLVNGDIEDALEVRHFMYSTLENPGQIQHLNTNYIYFVKNR
jgi:hypothetical protein